MKVRVTATALVVALGAVGGCTRPDHAKQADSFFAASKYNEAHIAYRSALQDEPNRGDLRLKLAETYTHLSRHSEARGEYIRAADLLPDSVDANLKAAQMLLGSRQIEDARTRAEYVLQLDPKNVDALLVKGAALAGQHDLAGAMAEFQEALAIDPANSSAHRNVGVLQLSEGRRDDATATLRRAVEMAPDSLAAHQTLGSFLWSIGDREAAEIELKAAYALDSRHREVNSLLGILYLTTGRPAEAEPYFKFVATSSDTTGAWLALTDFYQMIGRTQEARELIERMMSRSDGQAAATVRMAGLEFREGNLTSAQTRLRALLKDRPTDPMALLLSGRISMLAGKPDEALADAKKVTTGAASTPVAVAARLLTAEILRSRDRFAEAKREYEEVLKLDTRSVAAAMGLTSLTLASGEVDKAVAYADRAYDLAPQDPEVQALVVRTRIRVNRIAEARLTLAKLQKSHPDSVRVANLTAMTQLLDQQVDAARASYRRALELDPHDFEALNGLVQIALRTRRDDEARKIVDTAMRGSDSPSVNVLTLAARVYANTGNNDRAEQLLTSAIALDPQRLEAYNLLSQLYFRQKRVDQAIVQMKKLQERDPQSVPAATVLGMIYEMQDRTAEAEQEYRRALSIDSRAAVAANNLAWLLASSNRDIDTALELARDAKRVAPDEPTIDDTLGWIYYRKAMFPQAVLSLNSAVERAPDEPLHHYHLGMAYLQSGNSIGARRSLERALKLSAQFEGAADAKQQLARIQH